MYADGSGGGMSEGRVTGGVAGGGGVGTGGGLGGAGGGGVARGGVGVADGAADAATTGGVGLAGADDSAASLVGARSEAACTQGGTTPSLPNPSRFPEAASGSLSSASSSGAS